MCPKSLLEGLSNLANHLIVLLVVNDVILVGLEIGKDENLK
jgi:hypothetical protein